MTTADSFSTILETRFFASGAEGVAYYHVQGFETDETMSVGGRIMRNYETGLEVYIRRLGFLNWKATVIAF